MSKLSKRAKIIIVLGVLVALMPIIGLPGKAESVIIVLLGIAIAMAMYFAEKRVSTCVDCDDNKGKVFEESGEKSHHNPKPDQELEKKPEKFMEEGNVGTNREG